MHVSLLISVAMGLVHFLMCVTHRVEGWLKGKTCMGEDSCSSQTTKEALQKTGGLFTTVAF